MRNKIMKLSLAAIVLLGLVGSIQMESTSSDAKQPSGFFERLRDIPNQGLKIFSNWYSSIRGKVAPSKDSLGRNSEQAKPRNPMEQLKELSTPQTPLESQDEERLLVDDDKTREEIDSTESNKNAHQMNNGQPEQQSSIYDSSIKAVEDWIKSADPRNMQIYEDAIKQINQWRLNPPSQQSATWTSNSDYRAQQDGKSAHTITEEQERYLEEEQKRWKQDDTPLKIYPRTTPEQEDELEGEYQKFNNKPVDSDPTTTPEQEAGIEEEYQRQKQNAQPNPLFDAFVNAYNKQKETMKQRGQSTEALDELYEHLKGFVNSSSGAERN